MCSEGFRRVLLEPEYLRGLIQILFATLIASGPKTAIDSGTRGDGVRLGKRDSVSEK